MSTRNVPALLAHRRWWFCTQPFPHVRATDVFAPGFYGEMEDSIRGLLRNGLAEQSDGSRLSRMSSYDAFVWTLPPDTGGALGLFHDQDWHDLLARLIGVEATGDVNCAVHHHRPGADHGRIHCDLGVGWFPGATPSGTVTPSDPARCSYRYGDVRQAGEPVHEAVRAVTMIFYAANAPWAPGDGGETGLYLPGQSAVTAPAVRVPPLNNSLLVFENTPRARHAFVANQRSPRNSVILWLHRPVEQARLLFGQGELFRWPRPRDSAG